MVYEPRRAIVARATASPAPVPERLRRIVAHVGPDLALLDAGTGPTVAGAGNLVYLSMPRISPGGRCRTAPTQVSNPAVAQYPTMPAIDRLNPGNVLDRTGSSGSNT